MRADAPGKLVLSGAYAVLRGAPAVVTAVDRRVVADTKRRATFRAPEVLEGLALLEGDIEPPWFDATALRKSDDKLGLGSSAAICVASLGAVVAELESIDDIAALRERVYPLSRRAHRIAQGGGSGIDVAAACHGGTLGVTLAAGDPTAPPEITAVELPDSLLVEVWGASEKSASTSDFVSRVLALESSHPDAFDEAMTEQIQASHDFFSAIGDNEPARLINTLLQQRRALSRLGEIAELPIVPRAVEQLRSVEPEGGVLIPSGAGGGDVNLYVAHEPSSKAFRRRARDLGLFPVSLSLHAEGLRLLDSAQAKR